MRILAIGLGGAGCRIAGSLYTTDRRSSRVACVQALAIDVDGDTLAKLGDLPESAKVYFPALEAGSLDAAGNTNQTATIDIGEVIARIQNIESGDTDAIFICCGLGGSMANVAPHIVTALRASIVEPIFGLFTLPCLHEGEKRSAKAADDIEMLSPLLDGILLFDNETWSKKIDAKKAALGRKEKEGAGFFGFRRARQDISPADATRIILNDGIVRRISLILRAGEFKADGGIDLAEVVMDSGEVLNTMKGMGFITIGYAVEHLPQHPFGFLSRWRPISYFADEHKKKASRIVELAKQAIYNEISTPCDMTSAAKALVLVAGPSHELSMKGFMTVRKWIDRSIAGLETRSGDYPVTNTKYVAIIIMLSGLENIPRLTELNEIRAQYTASLRRGSSATESYPSDLSIGLPDTVSGETKEDVPPARRFSGGKDEMIVLPGKKSPVGRFPGEHSDETSRRADAHEPKIVPMVPGKSEIRRDAPPFTRSSPGADPMKSAAPALDQKVPPAKEPVVKPVGEEPLPIRPVPTTPRLPRRHFIVSTEEKWSPDTAPQRVPASSPVIPQKPPASQVQMLPKRPIEGRDPSLRAREDLLKKREQERLRIESELQRQRMMAISGHMQKKPLVKKEPHNYTPDIYQRGENRGQAAQPEPELDLRATPEPVQSPVPEKRTVIVAKKKHNPKENSPASISEREPAPGRLANVEVVSTPQLAPDEMEPDESKIDLREMVKRSNDEVLAGKGISKRMSPRVNDAVLFRTGFKPKKSHPLSPKAPPAPAPSEEEPHPRTSHLIRKREKKTADEEERASG
jgi:cell division GTPase FtsZ